jgi:hypothetical protein
MALMGTAVSPLARGQLAMAQEEKGITVRVLLYSGKPDPTYVLGDGALIGQVKSMIARAEADPRRPGWRVGEDAAGRGHPKRAHREVDSGADEEGTMSRSLQTDGDRQVEERPPEDQADQDSFRAPISLSDNA